MKADGPIRTPRRPKPHDTAANRLDREPDARHGGHKRGPRDTDARSVVLPEDLAEGFQRGRRCGYGYDFGRRSAGGKVLCDFANGRGCRGSVGLLGLGVGGLGFFGLVDEWVERHILAALLACHL